MVNVAQHDTNAITARVVIGLGLVAALVSMLSVVTLADFTHNIYTAGYYTISALFDAVGVDASSILGGLQSPTAFYVIIGVSILDGLVKIVIVGLVIAALIDTIGAIEARLRFSASGRRMEDHFVICGYTSFAEKMAAQLQERGAKFIIIERDSAKADEAREEGYTVLHEDFTNDSTLVNAGIEKAKAIIFMGNDDYDNLLGVITAHHLNGKVKIVSKAQNMGTVTKIHRAGAELCVVPEMIAGLEMGEALIGSKG